MAHEFFLNPFFHTNAGKWVHLIVEPEDHQAGWPPVPRKARVQTMEQLMELLMTKMKTDVEPMTVFKGWHMPVMQVFELY